MAERDMTRESVGVTTGGTPQWMKRLWRWLRGLDDGSCPRCGQKPLRLTVEPDGSISQIAGSCLDSPIDTRPTR